MGDEPVPNTKVWEDMKSAAIIINSLLRGSPTFRLFGVKNIGVENETRVMDMLRNPQKKRAVNKGAGARSERRREKNRKFF